MRHDRRIPTLDSSTLTLLFTDMVGSTGLFRALGSDADTVMEGHEDAIGTAVEAAGGVVVDQVGDSVFAAFGSASRAVVAAVEAQRALGEGPWPQGAQVLVRMGLNSGEPTVAGGRYFGRAVNRASHICEAAHGGQILLSVATRELAEDLLPAEVATRDLGEHPIGERRERLFQVVAPGLETTFPTPRRVGHAVTELPFPSGTVTFLFTDIEDSTFLTRALGDAWPVAHAEHRRMVRAAAEEFGGYEVDTQGDSFFFVFVRARDAAKAAVAVQHQFADHRWAEGKPVRVRVGIHTGEPTLGEEGYLGLDVVRGARICAIAAGGDVLLSGTTHALLGRDELPGAHLEPLGLHRLKGLNEDHELFRLSVHGIEVGTETAERRVAALSRALP